MWFGPKRTYYIYKRKTFYVFNERLKKIVLFGSEARNEAGPESDIDILVLLDEVKDFGSDLRICVDSIYLLSLEIDRRISVKPFSISEYEHTDCPLFRHAHSDGIVA